MVRFTLRRLFPPGNHSIGGWVSPRTSLVAVEKIIYLLLSGLEFRPPVVQLARYKMNVTEGARGSYVIIV
jgi:hypothetical protein